MMLLDAAKGYGPLIEASAGVALPFLDPRSRSLP
jgi:hypothetical protein